MKVLNNPWVWGSTMFGVGAVVAILAVDGVLGITAQAFALHVRNMVRTPFAPFVSNP